MNTIQFIQQHGVDKAREVVEGAPETATHFMYDSELMMADYLKYRPDVSEFSFDLWCGKPWGWKPFLRTKKQIDLSELKLLVEGVDLIGKYHSIDHAKNHYNNMREALNQYQYENKDIDDLSNELKQAIADYESIYGVSTFKVGDKAVLKNSSQNKVMKIQAYNDEFIRAYYGDQDYSFAHESNFRHATPEEIAAGHRIDNDMGDDSHIENHISKNCKVIDYD